MIIPHRQLSQEALQGLLEEFVTRDGTDYGELETPLETRVNQVRQQLETGTALIVYNQSEERCSILSAEQVARESGSFE
ncbi:MAG: YheU family protein [Gammaproteobacteria bacterium]|nr:YheU family protein [Gammaproteobacteria bacterium]